MRNFHRAFTIVELLVVMAIMALLLAILLPALGSAVEAGRASSCASNLRQFGIALNLYVKDSQGQLPPFRLESNDDGSVPIVNVGTGMKIRPRTTAMLAHYMEGAFDNPSTTDERQSYDSPVMQCPSVPHWVDERNHAYGYNYQFLGNSRRRLSDPTQHVNWPVPHAGITKSSRTIVMGDCMGTAAAFAKNERTVYQLRGSTASAVGNHGYTLDPPYLASHGAGTVSYSAGGRRSALDPRHSGRANVLFFDGHVRGLTMQEAGYEVASNGAVTHGWKSGDEGEVQLTGDNRLWSGDFVNRAPPYAD